MQRIRKLSIDVIYVTGASLGPWWNRKSESCQIRDWKDLSALVGRSLVSADRKAIKQQL